MKPKRTSEPQYELVKLTPEAAHDMLGHNTHNRNLRATLVESYARDMLAGEWLENGESIKIDPDGTVIDGQHRLAAIVRAGVPQQMLVVRGLPTYTQETVDTGAKRTFADVLKLRGETQPQSLASVARRVCQWEMGVKTNNAYKPTNTELVRTLDTYPWLRTSSEVAYQVRRHIRIPGSIIGLGHWLFSQIDAEDCDYFFDRLADGDGLAATHPIAVLRRTLIENTRESKSSLSQLYLIAYMIKAWNAFRDGDDIRILRYRPGGANPDKFPEPR